MHEQLLAPEPADPEYDGQEPEAGRGAAIDMTPLWASRVSRADAESLDLTADRLRRLKGGFAKVGDDSRVRADRHTGQGARAPARVRPVNQQARRPQEPRPQRGWETGHWVDPMVRTRCGGAHRCPPEPERANGC
ncbi:hypothetical protein ACFY2H_38920 [Streptomyces griseofuscus]|uniref:hypothetical protein n=1 Tax=Streptomyces TaxID=1883 RepID=UPI00160007E7|nr:hypothetical protein [Streptomyces murinus]MBA9043295.1 hypothetical protein [Streptomyces murinus]